MIQSPVAYEAPKEQHVWDAIIAGAKAERRSCAKPLLPGRPAIIGGLQFQMPERYREILKTSTPYAFIDRAPINGKLGSGIYRVIPNAYHCHWTEDRPRDRFERFGGNLRPWKRDGKHIVVLASSGTCNSFWGRPDWINETVRTLQAHTDRPILLREKGAERPLEHALNGAHAVVSFVSMAAVEAAMMGIPVFADPMSPASQIGLNDIRKIETPIYPDRERWASTLGYWQFTVEEMRSGYCWSRVRERL